MEHRDTFRAWKSTCSAPSWPWSRRRISAARLYRLGLSGHGFATQAASLRVAA
ncbi:MAG: hypothetical protein VB143_06705 [Burkholderia sp.]